MQTMPASKGCLHIYCGDGKGKTTAAIGLAVRALGAGLRVGVACFLKDGTSSELAVLEDLPRCRVFPCPSCVPFTFSMTAEERLSFAEYYHALLQEVLSKAASFDVLILDEILDVLEAGLAEEATLLSYLDGGSHPEIVLTGRRASEMLTSRAAYITVMHAKAHPYQQGQTARRGIEF